MSRKQSLNEVEILARQQELAKLSKEQLNKMSRDRLRELCSGVLEHSNKDLKATLVDKIYNWTEPVRLEKIAAYQLLKEELSTYSIDDKEIETIVSNTSPEVAARLLQDIMQNKYTQITRVKTILPKIIKYVTGLKDSVYADEFAKVIRTLNNEDSKQIKKDYSEKVAGFNKNQLCVNFESVITWARQELLSKRDWRKVSASLSITSGRRMVEIHSTGKFKITEDSSDLPIFEHTKGYLDFSGQAKERQNMTTKESKESYIIPILVEHSIWMEAYNWLVKEGKCNLTEVEVNKNISANIARNDAIGLKKLFNPDKITKTVKRQKNGESIEVEVEIGDYKMCRDFYAGVFRRDFKTIDVNYSEAVMLGRLLGHGENDLSTQHSYAKLSVKF